MSDLFGGNSTIDIDLSYTVEKTKGGGKTVKILTDDEAVKLKATPEKKDAVRSNRFTFQTLSWAASNRVLKQATVWNWQANISEIDWNAFRDLRLKAVLVDWDIKDANNVKVPLTEAAIDSLHQSVVLELIARYDAALSVDEEASAKN